jgi:hypothetical protein
VSSVCPVNGLAKNRPAMRNPPAFVNQFWMRERPGTDAD